MKNTEKPIRRAVYAAPDANLPKGFMEQVPDFFDKKGETIHKARNEIKIYEHGNAKINVKKFCIPPVINRFIYSALIRTPKAKRAYNNALEIRKRGFNTPKPLGYIIERGPWLINHSYFVSEQVEGMRPVGHGCENTDLIKALAKYTAQLHEAGLLHRDFTPGNILYSESGGAYTFSMVDINRFLCSNKKISASAATEALQKPFSDEKMMRLFVSEYCRHRGFNARIRIFAVTFWLKVRKKYDSFKRVLKKIPGAKYLIGKPISGKYK